MKDDPEKPTWFGPFSDLRLTATLARMKTREGGYAALARAITALSPEAQKGPDRDVVGRRKLKLLVEGGPTEPTFTLAELRALDRYLDNFGEGLAYRPLFVKPDLMQLLAESGRVTFLLGSRSDAGGIRSFSAWDVRAAAVMQRSLSLGRSVQFDILEVPLEEIEEKGRGEAMGDEWREALDERGTVVCIGSSRAIPATELMSCRMFGRKPFVDSPRKLELPFHFVWNPKLQTGPPSSFRLEPGDVAELASMQAAGPMPAGASGLALAGELLVDGVSARSWGDTYAVCAVQRRKHGRTWLVLAGVTGPATYAAAKAANRLTVGIPTPPDGEHSDPYWAVIRGRVSETQAPRLRALREFGEEVLKPPTPWTLEAGRSSLEARSQLVSSKPS